VKQAPVKPRKSYSLEFKAKLIGIYESWQVYERKEEKSINKMAAITGIDRRVLGRWFNPVKAAQILGSTFFILDN
jgi:hypothetical protein